jgi:hypothetical protein
MPLLPGSLALASIADGSLIVAADHRNNYAAIQAAVNALIADLGAGLAGQVLGLSPSTVSPVYPPGYEYAYGEITAPVSITATTDATANDCADAPSVTFDGSTIVEVEFYSPKINPGSDGRLLIALYENGSSKLRLADIQLTNSSSSKELLVRRRLTPPAGSDNYSVRAFVTAGTGTVGAGAGGSGNLAPGYIRVTKV